MILKNIFYEFYLLYICVYMKNEYYEKGFYHYMCVFGLSGWPRVGR